MADDKAAYAAEIRREMSQMVREARRDFEREIRPRDQFEQSIVNALGEISWEEAMAAIAKHRASPTVRAEP